MIARLAEQDALDLGALRETEEKFEDPPDFGEADLGEILGGETRARTATRVTSSGHPLIFLTSA